MARKKKTITEEDNLNFHFGKNWRKNPALYRHIMHSGDTVRHCEYCGRAMTSSDVNDYGSLCEDCYMKEYY